MTFSCVTKKTGCTTFFILFYQIKFDALIFLKRFFVFFFKVRQAIAKRPELANSEECALIEFTDSAAARAALSMSLGDARIYELQQSPSNDKKRKQQSQPNQQPKSQHQQQPVAATKKSVHARIARENAYNSSSCASGSEAEDPRVTRNGRQTRAHPVCQHVAFAPNTGHTFQGKPDDFDYDYLR